MTVTLVERDVELPDGRSVHVYDSGAGRTDDIPTVYWHHGSPQSGMPPEPLVRGAAARNVRWLSHDRPGYGRSTPLPGRRVGAVAADVAFLADAAGVDRFVVMGASGGGPHALACAGRLADRVLGVVCLAGVAPFEAAGLDWFAAMGESGAAEFRAAAVGRDALAAHLATGARIEQSMFAPADLATFSGPYGPWLASSVGEAMKGELDGYLDDYAAFVTPWDFPVDRVDAPVLLVHGERDLFVASAHSRWLADRCRHSELWLTPDDGHLSVFQHGARALDWLLGPR